MTVWLRHSRQVTWSDTDPSGAYTFVSALQYVEDAEVRLWRALGLIDTLYPRLPRIYVRADYHTPARFGDEVDVYLAIARVGRSSIHLDFRIQNGQSLCASGRIGLTLVDDSYRAAELPSGVREALAPYVTSPSSGSVDSADPFDGSTVLEIERLASSIPTASAPNEGGQPPPRTT